MEQTLTNNRVSVRVEKQQVLFLWTPGGVTSGNFRESCLIVTLCTCMVKNNSEPEWHGPTGTGLHKIFGQSPTWGGSLEVGETVTKLYI